MAHDPVESFIEDVGNIVGSIIGAAIWLVILGAILATCTKHPETKLDEGRFLPANSTDRFCSYMFSDGSIADYTRNGECPATMVDELEAE